MTPSAEIGIGAAPRPARHRVVAATALVATSVVAVASVVLLGVARAPWHVGQWYYLVDVADAFVFGAVGWMLASRVSTPVAWIVVGCGFGGAVAAFSSQWTALRSTHPDVAPLPLLESAQSWAWIPGTLAMILVVPWLVRRRPMDLVGRIGVPVGIVVTVGMVATRWTDPFPWPDEPSVMPFALHDEGWVTTLERIDRGFMAAIVIVGLAAAADLTRRWVSLEQLDARRGLGWLAVGVTLMTLAFAPLALPASWVDGLPVGLTPTLHLASQLFFPGALLVAVLGQRMWDIELAVGRGLVWSSLTGAIVTGYVVVVAVIATVIPGLDDRVTQVAAAALTATMVDPIRRWVQRRVDRLVHGDAREPLRAVDRIGATIGSTSDPRQLLSGVLEGTVESLRLSGATIDITAARHAGVTSVGDVSGAAPHSLPLVLENELVGALTVWPRPGERLDQRTVRAIDALLPTVAAAALLAVRASELAQSREALATARDEERRAIRRELHDGLGPALAGIGYGLRASHSLIDTDPERAHALLAQLADEIDARIEDVRTLARDMVPPLLSERGLAAAIDAVAERHRLGGLAVDVSIDERVGLGHDAASTLYAIIVEALVNVHRHAQATRATITLEVAGATLLLRVRDDGIGIDPTSVAGVGTQSMHERARSLGAVLTIGPGPGGGSMVELTVPLFEGAP